MKVQRRNNFVVGSDTTEIISLGRGGCWGHGRIKLKQLAQGRKCFLKKNQTTPRPSEHSGSNRTRSHCRHRRAPSRQIAGRGRTGNSTTSSMVTAPIVERKVTALETAGARRKRVKNPELPTTGRRAVAAVGATSAGVGSTLRTGTVACARALSTGCETVRSAELKRAQCWQN